ncbi:MAG: VWA domain-containing protein [Bryobacterales bacterium]|nr:VWA domain-containing protein [Bryobacterales bacterium]
MVSAVLATLFSFLAQTPLHGQSGTTYSLTPIGGVRTGANFKHLALNGNLLYGCATDSVATVNISNPSAPALLATSQAAMMLAKEMARCGIGDGRLIAFADHETTLTGNAPGLVVFSLSDPQNPLPIKEFALNKRWVNGLHFRGGHVYATTNAGVYAFGILTGQYGDLLALNFTDPLNPSLVSTLRSPPAEPIYGGPGQLFGMSNPSSASTMVYAGGSTSIGSQNTGTGFLQTVETSNPAAMTVLNTLNVAGTVHLWAPIVDGTLGISIGNTGGMQLNINTKPVQAGNTVIVTFDLTNPQSPAVRRVLQTQFKPGLGGGAAKVGPNRFAFAGVRDLNSQEVLLIVDTTDPVNPVIQPVPIANPMESIAFHNGALYAAEGKAGLGIYNLSTTTSQCGPAVDLAIVLDRSNAVSIGAFAAMKSSAQALVDQLRAQDRVSVVSFTTTGTVNQILTADRQAAKAAIEALTTSGNTSIGAGIASAQQELMGVRRNATAQPVMVVISDGRDLGSANPAVTPDAATAAKSAGIRLMTVAVGGATALRVPGRSKDGPLWAGLCEKSPLSEALATIGGDRCLPPVAARD